ncbi:MAG: hypothetical protein AB7P08_17315 [Burkholderiales bacterium]
MDFLAKLMGAAGAAKVTFLERLRGPTSEIGKRTTAENEVKYLHRAMWVDPELRETILDVRRMDRLDHRVKRVHAKTAMDVVKGGIVITVAEQNDVLRREWDTFKARLQLDNPQKLKSDARLLLMQGNLPLQWVYDANWNVVEAVAMPAETIMPDVDGSGRFKDPAKAYFQLDAYTGLKVAEFALFRLSLARLDPDNFDDLGCMGRPFLDAARTCWKKLTMTEEDLVIRRRSRAHLRLAHTLEGAKQTELDAYQAKVEKDRFEITTDYYLNKKGGVQAIQGDAALGEIADVVHLLDTFFAGSPFPKQLLGYAGNTARDVLEDLKRTYYDEVDSIQDTLTWAYDSGFRLHLLFKGMNPDELDYEVKFAERRTETPQQTTDRALKLQALGLPMGLVWEELGLDPQYVLERLIAEKKSKDPYPGGEEGDDVQEGIERPGKISVTPGNARKGESATDITLRG